MPDRDAVKLDRKLDRFADKLPNWAARWLRWLRTPSSRWVRIPLAILLIGGGFLSVLPIFGLWMLPLGALLLAQDVPVLGRLLLPVLTWGERQWGRLRRRFWPGDSRKRDS